MKASDKRIRKQLSEHGYKVRKIVTHRMPPFQYGVLPGRFVYDRWTKEYTRLLASYEHPGGNLTQATCTFTQNGQRMQALFYLLDGAPLRDSFLAEDLQRVHLNKYKRFEQ